MAFHPLTRETVFGNNYFVKVKTKLGSMNFFRSLTVYQVLGIQIFEIDQLLPKKKNVFYLKYPRFFTRE